MNGWISLSNTLYKLSVELFAETLSKLQSLLADRVNTGWTQTGTPVLLGGRVQLVEVAV